WGCHSKFSEPRAIPAPRVEPSGISSPTVSPALIGRDVGAWVPIGAAGALVPAPLKLSPPAGSRTRSVKPVPSVYGGNPPIRHAMTTPSTGEVAFAPGSPREGFAGGEGPPV